MTRIVSEQETTKDRANGEIVEVTAIHAWRNQVDRKRRERGTATESEQKGHEPEWTSDSLRSHPTLSLA